jgi:hypothetical protein
MSVPATPVVALTPAQAAAVMKDASRPTQWTNYNLLPSPYPWSNVYTPVGYTTDNYKNNRGILNSSIPPNQNTNTQFHHLKQPRPSNVIPQTGLQLQMDPQYAHVGQSGGSISDVWNGIKKVGHFLKRGHDVIKEHKLASRGLDIASHFRPDLKQYADKARQLGYGEHSPLDGADKKYFQTGGSALIHAQKYGIIDGDQKYVNPSAFRIQPLPPFRTQPFPRTVGKGKFLQKGGCSCNQ